MSKSEVTFNGETITAITVEGITLNLNPDPDMHVAQIRDAAEEVELFERRILGRADGLDDDFDSASIEFTDVIKWNIDTESDIQHEVWMKVCESLRFCAAITEEWADTLSAYKQERRRLIQSWNDRASAYETDSGIAAPTGFSDSENAENALKEIKDEIEGDERRAHSDLSAAATDARSELAYGATPEAVQRLIDGGYFNWAYFNLGGDIEAIPIDMEGSDAAEELVDFSEDPENYDGDIAGIIAILNNIALVSAERKKDGEETSRDEEIEFLAEFYDSLEQSGGASAQPPGVFNVADDIIENNDIDDEQTNLILGGLGGGILVLSDEDQGGGYEHLPQSVQHAAEGPRGNDPLPPGWVAEAAILGRMMGHANPEVQGGEQFSVNLTQSLGYALDGAVEDAPELTSWRLESLIDASARNEDANHAILTGSGDYEHPIHGLEPKQTLRGLYTYDWDDDGAAVGGVTDWIWEQADGTEKEQERSGEAMASFVQLFEDPAFNDAISGTGHKVNDRIELEDGTSTETTWRDASAGQVNPELAWAWSELFDSYIDDFGGGYGLPVGMGGVPDDPDDPGPGFNEGRVDMTPGARINFLQQIMGDETAATRINADTMIYSMKEMHDFTSGEGEQELDTSGATASGVLRGLMDEALEREAEVRQTKNEDETEYQQRIEENRIDLAAAVVADIAPDGLGAVNESIKISRKDALDFETHDAEPNHVNIQGNWDTEEQLKLTILNSLPPDHPKLDSMPPGVVQKDDDGNEYIPISPSMWEIQQGRTGDTLDLAWDHVFHDDWKDTDFNHNEAATRYRNSYVNAREKVQEEIDEINAT